MEAIQASKDIKLKHIPEIINSELVSKALDNDNKAPEREKTQAPIIKQFKTEALNE
jgi:hypothetical protein